MIFVYTLVDLSKEYLLREKFRNIDAFIKKALGWHCIQFGLSFLEK